MNIEIDLLAFPTPGTLPLEIVERKGIGHPDTICDALAETFSNGLSRYYLERFGSILHHNVDKALLCGGAARPAFGGGECLAPIEIRLAGRATCEVGGVTVPVEEIAVEGSRRWIQEHLPHLDPVRGVRILTHVRPTSTDLSALFRRAHESRISLANDTSCGLGFAPLDELERVVLAVERRLNAPETRKTHPALGQDVKVMGMRHGGEIVLTVACAIVDRYVTDLADYHQKKSEAHALAIQAAQNVTATPVRVGVNVADTGSAEGNYLTVTGLSAESGDDGQVGRGNRVNGLITPYRPMSFEAAAGKNPVTHVGKLYNIMAMRVAQRVVEEAPAVEECYCSLLGCIGHPIDEPAIFELEVRPAEQRLTASLARRIEDIARAEFATVSSIWREAIEGSLTLW
jgi:S-adenosylmethionine synthetase